MTRAAVGALVGAALTGALLAGAVLTGCSDDASGPPPNGGFVPGAAALLSAGSPEGDEDPCVLRAADGSLYVAWFSRRQGNADIYITRWEGHGWHDAVRVTTHADGDFAPSLVQDAAGWFHVVWFRFQLASPFFRYLVHNRSADGLTWDVADERPVVPTPPPGGIEDWVPTLAVTADDSLRVFFVSKLRGAGGGLYDLFTAASGDHGDTWTDATPLPQLNAADEHDHLPLVARTAAGLAITWVRYDASAVDAWDNTTSDVMLAQSTDGRAWQNVRNVTNDDVLAAIDVFPGLFATGEASATHLVWMTTRAGTAQVVALPLADAANYPGAAFELPLAGYSPRVAPTTTSGVYLGVWVQGADPTQDLYYRFFSLAP